MNTAFFAGGLAIPIKAGGAYELALTRLGQTAGWKKDAFVENLRVDPLLAPHEILQVVRQDRFVAIQRQRLAPLDTVLAEKVNVLRKTEVIHRRG